MPLVVCPLAFVDATDLIDTDAIAMTHLIFQLTTIKRLLVTFDGEVQLRLELLEVKQVGDHLVDQIALLFCLSQVLLGRPLLVFHSL